jgi:glycopeptide antibiotics resistance protein
MIHNVANSDETLTIPEIFKPVQRKFLSLPGPDFRWNWSFVQDVTINLLGFIPFGFFFSAFLIKTTNLRRGVSYLIVALVGAGLSLSIELIQAWLPTRDSSLIDVICNSGGTILGIVIFQIVPQNPIPTTCGGE